jgi:tetratricopeptide (TPR) repeat protein
MGGVTDGKTASLDAGSTPAQRRGVAEERAGRLSGAGPAKGGPALPWLVSAGLALLVLAVYARVAGHGFVNLDDAHYVSDNPRVLRGLTWEGVAWAFGTFQLANWHPLTWLSHMADVELFGLDPGRHHLVSVAFHAACTVLVFLVLRAATGATWRSAAVAALFGVHPLHVESVAWVSERKDVLSTLLGLLALAAWIRYVRRPSPGRYLPVAFAFALSLLAKPMLVTLPFLLLLLDFWPLGRLGARFGPGPAARGGSGQGHAAASAPESGKGRLAVPTASSPRSGGIGLGALLLEKAPLLALSAASSAVTWVAQSQGGATTAMESVPIASRVANAAVAYGFYLAKTFWPSGLAAFYPHPAIAGGGHPWWQVAGSLLLLAALSALALWRWRTQPWLAVGWLWYLGTLVPVIGLVQVGAQAAADRYTYVPLVGIFVAVVWAACELLDRLPWGRALAAAAGAAAVLAFAGVGWKQAGHWRDSISLHLHATRVTERNWVAWRALGDAYAEAGRLEEATAAHREALRILPGLAEAWHGLGVVAGRLGRHEEAIAHIEQALRIRPRYATAWLNLGSAQALLGRYPEAVAAFRNAVRDRPDDVRAWSSLGLAALRAGDVDQAVESERRLRELDPVRADQLRHRIESGR